MPEQFGTSASKVVPFQRSVSLATSKSSVARGTLVTFSGSVGPSRPGGIVYLQRWTGTTWATVTSAKLSSTSRFSLRLK